MQNATNEEIIVLKENKTNALIACWECGKQTWVKKGSKAYNLGLCGNCAEDTPYTGDSLDSWKAVRNAARRQAFLDKENEVNS